MCANLLYNHDNNLVVIGTGGVQDYPTNTFEFTMEISGLINRIESPNKNKISTYPNSCESVLRIETNSDGLNPNIKLYDLVGKLVKHEDQIKEFNVSEVPVGFYILVCEIDGVRYSEK